MRFLGNDVPARVRTHVAMCLRCMEAVVQRERDPRRLPAVRISRSFIELEMAAIDARAAAARELAELEPDPERLQHLDRQLAPCAVSKGRCRY